VQDGQFDEDTQADPGGVAGQVAPHEVEAQDQAAEGRPADRVDPVGRGTAGRPQPAPRTISPGRRPATSRFSERPGRSRGRQPEPRGCPRPSPTRNPADDRRSGVSPGPGQPPGRSGRARGSAYAASRFESVVTQDFRLVPAAIPSRRISSAMALLEQGLPAASRSACILGLPSRAFRSRWIARIASTGGPIVGLEGSAGGHASRNSRPARRPGPGISAGPAIAVDALR
jgi:hypothetical protein